MSELLISSEAHQQEVIGQPGEVTWIDRALLSNNTDLTLHRRPRCPGLRYVDHQWELFNRDADHSVYIAPYASAAVPNASWMLPASEAAFATSPASSVKASVPNITGELSVGLEASMPR